MSPETEPRDDRNDAGSGGSDECDDRGGGGGAPVDGGGITRSRQRKEIEAAIAAAEMEQNHNQEDSPGSDRRHVDPERRSSATRRRKTETREEPSHRKQGRRRQRQSSGAGDLPEEDNDFVRGDQQLEAPTRPIGKPPRAPPRSEDRSRQPSGARRGSSAREVDESPDGSGGDESNTESFAWRSGDCSDVDEVLSEEPGSENEDGIDNNWTDNHFSDVEGSVWEEPFSFKGWDRDEDRRSPRDGDPPALVGLGKAHVQGPPSRDDPRRRQRHRVTGTQGKNQAGTENWYEERVTAPATRIAATTGAEGLRFGGGRASTEKRRPLAKSGGQSGPSHPNENLARSTNDVAQGSKNSRRRHQRRQPMSGRDREEDDEEDPAWEREEEDANASGSLIEPPPTLRGRIGKETDGSGAREQRKVAADDLDGESSCSSRWDLSAEDEAQERNGAENGTRAQRAHSSGDEARVDDGFRGRTIPADQKGRKGRLHGAETNRADASGTAEHGVDNVAGVVPEYLEDFFEGSEKEGPGNDVPLAVSSPR